MRTLRAAALCAGLALAGCAGFAQGALDLGQSLSTALPSDVRTLDQAVLADTLCMDVSLAIVQNHKFPKATLVRAKQLNDEVNLQLRVLEHAHASGQMLYFAAFNVALHEFKQYSTQLGV